jgi:hypothetical protein
MKRIIGLLVVAFVLSDGLGAVNIDWQASSGFYFNSNPAVGILGDGTGNSTIAQLIYTLSGNVNDALIGGGVTGDNVIWSQLTITEDGIANDGVMYDSYAWFLLPNNYQQAIVSGYVYARIFENSSVNMGDWYYYTTPIALVDIVSPNAPQLIEMNTDLVDGNAIDFGSNVAQVIPEPATALLFILGSMGAWLVRRNNKMKADAEAEA